MFEYFLGLLAGCARRFDSMTILYNASMIYDDKMMMIYYEVADSADADADSASAAGGSFSKS